jgi:acetyltransferase-like isoleucine patch superfamily enzyme
MNIPERIQGALARPIAWLVKLNLKLTGVQFGSGLAVLGHPIVSIARGAAITLGSNVMLLSWSRFTALGVNHPVVLRALKPGAKIVIGNHVGMSGGTICAEESVMIGDSTMLGANVTIIDTDFHPLEPENRRYSRNGVASAPVVIGENVFIGSGSIILKGITIGANSVIGAGSIVASDIPANCIAAGNPCRVLRSLPVEAIVQAKL